MARPPSPTVPTRRAFLAAGAAAVAGLAGCSALDGSRDAAGDGDAATADTATVSAPATTRTTGGSPATAATRLLRVHADGLLAPVVRDAAAHWNANPSPVEYRGWSPTDHGADPGTRLADHFASTRGIAPTGERARPPFPVVVGYADDEAVAEDLAAGRVDVGATDRAAIDQALAGEGSETSPVPHAVARSGSVFGVSPAIRERIDALPAAEVRAIYAGEIDDWTAVGGPARTIHAITGPAGTPPRPIRRGFFEGLRPEGVDERTASRFAVERLRERDDAIATLGAASVRIDLTIDLVVDGERLGPRDPAYPASRPERCFTRGDPDDRERAFIDYLQSRFAQATFVHGRHRRLVGIRPASG